MSVTVANLIEELQKLPQDHIVVLSKDEEGNGFHSLAGITQEEAVDPESYYIDFYDESEEPNVVVLWP